MATTGIGDLISKWAGESKRFRRNDISTTCFYASFFVYSFLSWVNLTQFQLVRYSFGNALENAIQLFVLVFLTISFSVSSFPVRRKLISAVLVLFGFLVWRISREGWLFWTCLFIACAPEFDQKKLSKAVILILLTILAVSTLTVLLGFFPAEIVVRSDNGVVRNGLGFLHPNSLGLALSVLGIAFCVLRFESFRLAYVPVYLLAAGFVYFVPVSRTSALLIVFTLVLWFAFSRTMNSKWKKYIICACFAMFLTSIALSLVLMIMYDGTDGFIAIVDKLLSGRAYFANQYFEASGLKLFGYSFLDGPNFVADGVDTGFLVDNAYDHVLLRYGIISFLLLFGAIAALYIKAIRTPFDAALLCGLTLFILMAISEVFACRVECDYLLISLAFIFDDLGMRQSESF